MPEAYLGLGSNIGDREAMLRAAVAELAAADGVAIIAASPIFETPPWGPVPQDAYLNACLRVRTSLPASELLGLAHVIEHRHGRERSVRFGPRTLDIDLLLYDDTLVDENGLVVPHPRMAERAFVLVPLATIAPALAISGRPITCLIASLDSAGITNRSDLAPLIPFKA